MNMIRTTYQLPNGRKRFNLLRWLNTEELQTLNMLAGTSSADCVYRQYASRGNIEADKPLVPFIEAWLNTL